MITQEKLKQVLSYSPETGVFRWAVNKPPRAISGAIAGFYNGNGYIRISVSGVREYAHRLAFLWMTGEIPDVVDHINHCRSDNRWANLRSVSQAVNVANVGGRDGGVRMRYGRWYARFGSVHIGVFDTEESAREARRNVEVASAGLDPNASRDVLPVVLNVRTHDWSKYDGKSLLQWARETGIPQPTLHWRVKVKGMTIAEAISKRSPR
jgi:hypothetical protein